MPNSSEMALELERPPTPALRKVIYLASLFARRDRDKHTRLKHLDEAIEKAAELRALRRNAWREKLPATVPAVRLKRKPLGYICPHCGHCELWYRFHKSHLKRCESDLKGEGGSDA